MPAPIKVEIIDGQHFVVVEGRKKYGPYATADEADTMAQRSSSIYYIFRGGGLADQPAVKRRASRRFG